MNKENNSNSENKIRKDVLLTFYGEQDLIAFSNALKGLEDMMLEESGGSREWAVFANGDGLISVGYKKEVTV